MISHITSTSDAAMYGVAYNLAMILTFVLNAINGSYVPWLYGKIKKNNAQDNKSISLILIMLMGLIILCVIWYAPEIILIMAGNAIFCCNLCCSTSVNEFITFVLFAAFY